MCVCAWGEGVTGPGDFDYPIVRRDSISVPQCGADSQSQSCSQLIGQIRVAQMDDSGGPRSAAASSAEKEAGGGKRTKSKRNNQKNKKINKACPEVSRMDRCKLLENVKNYIICAEKCAYIFFIALHLCRTLHLLSALLPFSAYRTDHLLSSFETSRVGVALFFMQNFCVLQFIAYSICLGRQGHPTTTTIAATTTTIATTIATKTTTMQTNSKGPEHINKDFISFIRFVSFRFFLCFTTLTHTHTNGSILFLFFTYTHTHSWVLFRL